MKMQGIHSKSFNCKKAVWIISPRLKPFTDIKVPSALKCRTFQVSVIKSSRKS